MRLRTKFLVLTLLAGLLGSAHAGEADDLQRMIEVGRQGAKDLERLDVERAVREDLTLLGVWFDAAWRLRSEQRYDDVRVVLDRCQAQAEMIREKITASKLLVEATQKQAEAQRVRDEIARTRQALQAAILKKASLEGRAKP